MEVNDRIYSYNSYLQSLFGAKTYKIVVSSGLTCPTRDGTIDQGGCSFCDVRGSSSFFGKIGRGAEIKTQIHERLPRIKTRFNATRFLAYFQSYTNTYSDIEYLREIYEAALSVPEISGLCIGTRPDCLAEPIIDLLEELAKKTYVSLELGVQSFSDETLLWLERGHSRQCSIDTLELLKKRAPHVHVCVHLMFGNPTDHKDIAKEAALLVNQSGAKGVKLHQLMVLQNTKLGKLYREKPFWTASLEEYSVIVKSFLDHLLPNIYVERLCATATHPEECLAPDWSKLRWEPHNRLREMLGKTNTQQGSALNFSSN